MENGNDNNKEQWLREFRRFLAGNETPPAHVFEGLRDRVRTDLNPVFWSVVLKLAVIQLSVGAGTLLFCPQLGVGPVLGDYGLMYLFMHFGPLVCTAACGAFFFGLSMLFGLLLLRPEEFRVVRERRLIHLPMLCTLSLMMLMALGASGTLVFYMVWLGSALVGGEISSWIATRTRFSA